MKLTDRLLRLPEVMERVPYKKTKIYDLMSKNLFPKNIQLGSNFVVWKASEIDKWIDKTVRGANGNN
tara:strand:+ start:93 stop:293 length:201 start_codon:yes stop_codon:yes gene_type:complete